MEAVLLTDNPYTSITGYALPYIVSEKPEVTMSPIANMLFDYLYNVIYNPAHADLDISLLPEEFHEFGMGLKYFAESVIETKMFAQALSQGDLNCKIPSRSNELASPLKALHASLKHMTWQTQQVAKGDYAQRMMFLGDFADAFNSMAQKLGQRSALEIKERSRLQQYINLILSNMPDLLLVFDTKGKAVLASQAYIESSIFPSAKEIYGKTFNELFAPVSTDCFLAEMGEMFGYATEDKFTYDIEQSVDIGQRGEMRTYSIQITPMLHENNTVIGTIVVFHDMTDILQAKQDAERARELAEQSAKAKSDFLARMSHEMRTPMNAIIGMTQIGKNAVTLERKDYSFRKIENASTHLLGVINDVLDISKIEADKLELSFSEFNIHDMLEGAYDIISTRVLEKKQRFTLHIDEAVPSVIVSDEQHMTQVITNLLSNAVKFTPEQGEVSIFVEKTSDNGQTCEIRFSVKDTGIGISEEQKAHLFVPFEQADGSISRKFGGTGLGLAISRTIAEKLGGAISVESEYGSGSTFVFTAVVEKATGANECDFSPETEEHDFQGSAILLAEDIEINREILLSMLEPTMVEVDCAENGREAVRLFSENPDKYMLIFMDIQMPEMDGFEATKEIRSLGTVQAEEIPIIAMTANVFREDVEKCIDAGMNGHIGKPIDIDEVLGAMKGVSGGRQVVTKLKPDSNNHTD